ncbi:cell death activator CIDE-A [Podarcis lilfordi]|uniref:Cell death activator CIDE-A n=1 Tax=Podarcis lilfordi TaxID=74358 RepID=A0AA35P8P9_9SAUR|nr:cell death activator CIDE-A [Podarcis lilfordi]
MAVVCARDFAAVFFRSLVSVGASLGSVTRQTLFAPLPAAARPFRVCNHDRSSRRGVVASTLEELISKTLDTLMITAGLITLVLEEDGTVVETEDFFQSLGDNTHFMVLERGQKWKPGPRPCFAAVQQPKKMGVANITLDLYKVNPKDFIGCLNIKATFYEIYSVTYDIQCMGAKAVLRRILRYLSHMAQVTGHVLLYTGTYVLQLMGDYEEDRLTNGKR